MRRLSGGSETGWPEARCGHSVPGLRVWWQVWEALTAVNQEGAHAGHKAMDQDPFFQYLARNAPQAEDLVAGHVQLHDASGGGHGRRIALGLMDARVDLCKGTSVPGVGQPAALKKGTSTS